MRPPTKEAMPRRGKHCSNGQKNPAAAKPAGDSASAGRRCQPTTAVFVQHYFPAPLLCILLPDAPVLLTLVFGGPGGVPSTGARAPEFIGGDDNTRLWPRVPKVRSL
jgi:hypothetical protein